MPYPLSNDDRIKLGNALTAYYEDARQDGIYNALDRISQAGSGVVTAKLDKARDTYANLRKKSNDEFGVAFKAELKLKVKVLFANKMDVAGVMVGLGEKALVALAKKIPIPVLSTIVAKGVGFIAEEAKSELATRAIKESDTTLNGASGSSVTNIYTNETDAAEIIKKSMEQYKEICNYIKALPPAIATFDDAVTFPKATFKVQAAASALNVMLYEIKSYLESMQSRTEAIKTVVDGYRVTVRDKMPEAVEAVLQKGYADAYASGKTDIGMKKYSILPLPVLKMPEKNGGATLLAAYLAHALAQGYYDAGNEMSITRPRSNAVTEMPTRPRSNAIFGR